ncbi:MAG: hypothetical protein HUU04_00730 [Verrucomicrobiae bacterium]|nr:hypothetical protein [Verrucomicrobiae bacterium]
MLDLNDPAPAIRELRVTDSPRARLYSRFLDEGMDAMLSGAAQDVAGVARGSFDLEALPFGDPPDATGRSATAMTGYLAFCWAHRFSRFYRDDRVFRAAKARLLAFASQDGAALRFRGKNAQGDLGWDFGAEVTRGDVHENSWRLEPLLYAAWWLREGLTDAEFDRVRGLARRVADAHFRIVADEMNNRGVIRNAILCLAGRFLDDPRLVEEGIRGFHGEPCRVFNSKDGQINEGTGPDANYSGTTFIYLYIYRLFSGDDSVDEPMRDAVRWATRAFDPRGFITLFGASTRMPFPGSRKILDWLPAMERFAHEEPHLSWLIENGYLDGKDLGGLFHSVNPLIFAMLEHEGRRPEEDPGWFDYARMKDYNPRAGPELMYSNEGYATLYFLFRERWHASTTVFGRSPYKGLQHWGWEREAPVIWPTESHASKTIAWGMDTSHMNVSGVKFRDKQWREGPPHTLTMRFENVWHHYLLTRSTLLLLISSSHDPREDVWVIAKTMCGTPILESGCLRYEGRRGRMFFAQANPRLKRLGNAHHLRFPREGRTHLYAFSNESFRLLDFRAEGGPVRFSDETGAYEFDYEVRFFDEDDLRSIGYGVNQETSRAKAVVRPWKTDTSQPPLHLARPPLPTPPPS